MCVCVNGEAKGFVTVDKYCRFLYFGCNAINKSLLWVFWFGV